MTDDKGLSGLANLGNTCFMNTCIQLLSHTHELVESVKDKQIREDSLLCEWMKLRDMMWSENCVVNPGRWVSSVQKVALKKDMMLFTGFAQNDLPEFLIFLINTFHESISRKVTMSIKGEPENSTDDMAIKCYTMMKNMYQKEYSEILKLFFGIHVSQIVNPETKEVLSNSPEPYFIVELPIPETTQEVSLYDCFSHYSNPEHLDGDNAWYNEKTKEKEAVDKQMVFWSFPEVLVVSLKRFTNMNKKRSNRVTAPMDELDLSKYVKGYNKETYKYELYGVANHIGNAMGGHYFAYIKGKSGAWYEINDTRVNKISADNVITPKAYVFFYRKKE
jgi:ubiquitin carboxyl-terminal hydrolase 8